MAPIDVSLTLDMNSKTREETERVKTMAIQTLEGGRAIGVGSSYRRTSQGCLVEVPPEDGAKASPTLLMNFIK